MRKEDFSSLLLRWSSAYEIDITEAKNRNDWRRKRRKKGRWRVCKVCVCGGFWNFSDKEVRKKKMRILFIIFPIYLLIKWQKKKDFWILVIPKRLLIYWCCKKFNDSCLYISGCELDTYSLILFHKDSHWFLFTFSVLFMLITYHIFNDLTT